MYVYYKIGLIEAMAMISFLKSILILYRSLQTESILDPMSWMLLQKSWQNLSSGAISHICSSGQRKIFLRDANTLFHN